MPQAFLYPYARCLNALPGDALTITCNGAPLAADLPYYNVSRYQRVSEGKCQFALYRKGSSQPIAAAQVDMPAGGVITLAATGTPEQPELLPIPEPTDRTGLDVGNLRICDLSPTAPELDIYANGYPILQDITYPEISRYIYLKPGLYAFKINAGNTQDTLLTVPNQALEGHQYCTLYLVGNTAGDPALSAILSVDAATYMGQYL